ncbi:MAG: GNAT family N-acetyltransferase, partial [Candidatus Gracilibacteria bacterium]
MAETKEKQGPKAPDASLQAPGPSNTQEIEEIIKVKPEDLTEENLRLLAENLAEHTFLPENIIAGSVRMRIKDALKPVGEKLDQFGATTAGRIWQKLNSVIWGGYTKNEINTGIANRLRKMAEEGLLMGVKMDGKVVAVAGLKEHGKMPDGRSLYEISKVSTLPQYQGRKLGTKVMDAAIADFFETFPGMPPYTS